MFVLYIFFVQMSVMKMLCSVNAKTKVYDIHFISCFKRVRSFWFIVSQQYSF